MASWIELVVLFVVCPLGFLISPFRIPKIPALLLMTLLCLALLLRDKGFSRKALWHRAPLRGYVKTILLRAAFVAPALLTMVWFIDPDTLFIFPRTRPALWVIVMVLYPLLSACPQELIYRCFFFRRYRSLFKTESQMIWASTLAFAFLHILFMNPLAVLLTIPGGYLLSRTYARTESLLVTSIEHAIYGNLVFTIGLGFYFYRG
jgi:hypothetical protein